jgi:hypothetical protein
MKFSIENVTIVFHTNGSQPILVLCGDLSYYVCKYPKGKPTYELFNEFIIAHFAKFWGLNIPDFDLVNVKKEHIPDEVLSNRIQRHYFEHSCFGSQKLEQVIEVNHEFLNGDDKKEIEKIQKFDLLKIALFDIWLSNEDRNQNNYNLLLSSIQNRYIFYVIDHVSCFNSNNLDKGIYLITEEDSIISSPLCVNLLKGDNLLEEEIQKLKQNFPIFVQDCREKLSSSLSRLPTDWGIDIAKIENVLLNSLFSESWINEVFNTFEQFVRKYLIGK